MLFNIIVDCSIATKDNLIIVLMGSLYDKLSICIFHAINSLAPGIFKLHFGWVIFKLTLVTNSWFFSCEIPISWMSLNLTDDKSVLVQVMAWCHHATSQYLNQCWPRSMLTYGFTRLQWVNSSPIDKMAINSLMIYSDTIFMNETFCILIKISLKFVQ